MTDVTAVLNVHREGILAHSALLSLKAAQREAEAEGVTVEALVVVDRADAATLDYVTSQTGIRVLRTDVADLGLARNAGVEAARGRFIAFLDGDDLWGPNWLLAAFRAATAADDALIWHPEASLFFGPKRDPFWLVHPHGDTTQGDWVTLALRNHWTALSFALRETYRRIPYRANEIASGFGYEDWSWNAETIAHGYGHRPVLGTAHLVRVQEHSLVRKTSGANALTTPFSLMRRRIGWAARVGTMGVAGAGIAGAPTNVYGPPPGTGESS